MITIEVRENGRMLGWVEQAPTPEDPQAWRFVSIATGKLQSEPGFATLDEALESLLEAVKVLLPAPTIRYVKGSP